MSSQITTTHTLLRSFVDRVERLDKEIKTLNDDKRDIYAEAKSQGFDVKALKAVVAIRRKDAAELQEHNAIVETYLSALGSGTPVATRAPARPSAVSVTPAAARANEPDGLAIPDFLQRTAPTVAAE